jgi:hypothetical protein
MNVWVKKTAEDIENDKKTAEKIVQDEQIIVELRKARIENYKKDIDNAKYGIKVSEKDYGYLEAEYKKKLTKAVSGSQRDQETEYVFNNPNPPKSEHIDPYTITEGEYNGLSENDKLAYQKNWDYSDTKLYMLKVSIEDVVYNKLSAEYKAKFNNTITDNSPAEPKYGHERLSP